MMDFSHRHAYLIMAHNNWYTLERLILLLDASWNDIYIHIDKKAKEFNFDYFSNLCRASKIFFIKRRDVSWGGEAR